MTADEITTIISKAIESREAEDSDEEMAD